MEAGMGSTHTIWQRHGGRPQVHDEGIRIDAPSTIRDTVDMQGSRSAQRSSGYPQLQHMVPCNQRIPKRVAITKTGQGSTSFGAYQVAKLL